MSNIDNVILSICAKTGTNLTSEQVEVVKNFDKNIIVVANPGTGKTTTAVHGILTAQTALGIPGNKINAMSFTYNATAELSAKYAKAAKACHISPNVNFKTFHSICLKILRDYDSNFEIRNFSIIDDELIPLRAILIKYGVSETITNVQVKQILRAINGLNSELLYSEDSVVKSYKFFQISKFITYDTFVKVRTEWFRRNFVLKKVTQGEVPTAVLFLLMLYPEIATKLRKKYELMIVDEFQDMSVLYFEILRQISGRLIVLGDMKQQIYAFNGASPQIFNEYLNTYKDAKVLELTQSFRCLSNIVSKATEVIAPNEIYGYDNFKGCGDGGIITVETSNKLPLKEIVRGLKENQEKDEYQDVLFLSRNNASVIPVIEELYKQDVRFRCSKFASVNEIPLFKDLCFLAHFAMNSTSPDVMALIGRIFPEFRGVKKADNPILQVMKNNSKPENKDLFTMRYNFRSNSSYEIIECLKSFKNMERDGVPFLESMEQLLVVYDKYIIEGKWYRLEHDPDYYVNLVYSIISCKTYTKMMEDEIKKKEKNDYYIRLNDGVRCYTFHSSKGLEADTVYILDLDDKIVPSESKTQDLLKNGYDYEAGKEIRNERNLLYVALTRAKRNITITYNDAISCLYDSPAMNKYTYLDVIYNRTKPSENELNAFKNMLIKE